MNKAVIVAVASFASLHGRTIVDSLRMHRFRALNRSCDEKAVSDVSLEYQQLPHPYDNERYYEYQYRGRDGLKDYEVCS